MAGTVSSSNAKNPEGDRQLLRAAVRGDKNIVEYLIRAGADVNTSKISDNYTVLHYAAEYGWFEIVELLLEKRVNIQVKSKDGYSPLLLAAEERKIGIVKLLINAGADINCSENSDNYTVLHYASQYGWFEIVQILVNKNVDIQAKTKQGHTPLLLAAENSRFDIVTLLIMAGADVNCSESSNNYTVLHYVSEYDWLETLALLLHKQADVHAKTKQGDTPLLLAAENRKKNAVLLLMNAGADVIGSKNSVGYSLLHYAARNGWLDIVEYLLSKSVDIQEKTKQGISPLLLAAKNKKLDITELLIDAGADVNGSKDSRNYTPVHFASRYNWSEVVESLWNKGADIQSETTQGDSPLSLALENECRETVQFLINAGADINASKNEDGYKVLHFAAYYGWLEVVRSLLKKGADIQEKTKYGGTPLLIAAEKGHQKVIKLLLDAGADVKCSENKNTALHYASKSGWFDIVQSLLKKGADIQAETKAGFSPLYLAASNKHKNIIELLINAGADIRHVPSEFKGYTILHHATQQGWFEIVKYLLSKGASIEARTEDGETPLLLATRHEHKDIYQFLIDAGADVNCSGGKDNYSLLHFASQRGWLKVVKYLLDKGVNIQGKATKGETPLLLAARHQHKDIMELLINAGADVNCTGGRDNYTLLHYASQKGWFAFVQYLLNKGVNVQAKAKLDETPLLLAARHQHRDIIELLVYAGADVNCSGGRDKNTPLHYASQQGWLEMAQYLLNKGADIQVKDGRGDSALIMAADHHHKEIVQLLIDAGADVNCTESWNKYTVLHYAAKNGWDGIVQCLLNKGANIEAKDKRGDTPLLMAADSHHRDVVEILIDAGADLSCTESCSNYTVLHYAAKNGWCEVVVSLLKKDVNMEAKTGKGETALILAFEDNKMNVVEHLLKAGADCNVEGTNGNAPFSTLIRSSTDMELVSLFIKSGAYVKETDYPRLNRNYVLREEVLESSELCSQIVINEFNNRDLPDLYKLPYARGFLPRIENMRIGGSMDSDSQCNQSQATQQVIEQVKCEIEATGHCNVTEIYPAVLQMLVVKTFLDYCDDVGAA